jgi:hypothetical protein
LHPVTFAGSPKYAARLQAASAPRSPVAQSAAQSAAQSVPQSIVPDELAPGLMHSYLSH